MITFPELVANAFDLPAPKAATMPTDGERCVITGEPLTEGCRVADVLSATHGEFLETLNGNPHGYMSVAAATCWGASNPKSPHPLSTLCSRSFAVFGDTGYMPLISRESACKQERPCWADLVYDVWEHHRGEPCAIVLSTDTKKRVWPMARAGILGHATPALVYNSDQNVHRVITINWPIMLDALTEVSAMYEAGFAKQCLGAGLFRQMAVCESAGIPRALAWERRLEQLRTEEYWPFVYLIVQRQLEITEVLQPCLL